MDIMIQMIPDESQIQKATQNIVLNDITEPVVEQTYENADILSPTKTEDDTSKLNRNDERTNYNNNR